MIDQDAGLYLIPAELHETPWNPAVSC